jgi:hypothetical protein
MVLHTAGYFIDALYKRKPACNMLKNWNDNTSKLPQEQLKDMIYSSLKKGGMWGITLLSHLWAFIIIKVIHYFWKISPSLSLVMNCYKPYSWQQTIIKFLFPIDRWKIPFDNFWFVRLF